VTSRSRTPFVLAVVVAVVGLAALVAVLVTRDDSDDNDTASTATESDTASEDTIDPLTGASVTVEGEALPQGEGDDDPAVGRPAPTLRGTDYSGVDVSIAPGTEGPMMIVFLAHWCPVCNAEIPVLLEWRDSGEIPAELQIVGVSTAVSDARPNYPPGEWLREKGWEWPVLADDAELTALNAYGVTAFPYFVIVDADGNVTARGSGDFPVDELDALVEEAIT
jgi:cytochrome c biogenesis protein CcmG, thiol:disulfide interchange protein DsbE